MRNANAFCFTPGTPLRIRIPGFILFFFMIVSFTMFSHAQEFSKEDLPALLNQLSQGEKPVYRTEPRQMSLETKFITVNSLQIAYYESKGKGPAIVFIHGNSNSKDSFRRQMMSPLGYYFRMIAIDLPGHGESDYAVDPFMTYSAFGYADIVVQAAQQLDAEDAVFVGWSLGGHIVMEASQYLPNAKGFLIFGAPPIGIPPAPDAFLPDANIALAYALELTEEEVNIYTEAAFREGYNCIPEFFYEDVRQTDGMARMALGYAMFTGSYTDEIVIVENLTAPLAIFHGVDDSYINCAYYDTLTMPTLWRGSVQDFYYCGHTPQWERPFVFNYLLARFVLDANR